MLSGNSRYLYLFLQRSILCIGLVMFFSLSTYSQEDRLTVKSDFRLNPLILSSFKKGLSTNRTRNVHPALYDYLKPRPFEVVCFSQYPLTLTQRMDMISRENCQPIGKQIVSDIAESYINSILNGKNKKPVVVAPKF
jgi:hypothetical protein